MVDYQYSQDKIKIICPIHGIFEQHANNHLLGKGCSKCGNLKTTEQFISKAKSVHNGFYDYSRVDYKHSEKPVEIICSKHGEFKQLPYKHIQGQGCPKCFIEQTVSNPEKQLREFINQLGFETINNSRDILENKEIDIFIKDKNIGFEFNGIYFHQNKNHKIKFNIALSKSIKLYNIFEDSFINNIDTVKSFVIQKIES